MFSADTLIAICGAGFRTAEEILDTLGPSAEGTAWESPAWQCRLSEHKFPSPFRDGTRRL